MEIMPGNKVIEVRAQGINKGLVLRDIIENRPNATFVAIGDDHTDEDMFRALPDETLAVHVGPTSSQAQLRLADVAACRRFLRSILADPNNTAEQETGPA